MQRTKTNADERKQNISLLPDYWKEREGKEINHLGSPTVQITTPKLVNMQEISFNTFSFDAKAKKSPSIKSIWSLTP
jgi:hypothetical protein